MIEDELTKKIRELEENARNPEKSRKAARRKQENRRRKEKRARRKAGLEPLKLRAGRKVELVEDKCYLCLRKVWARKCTQSYRETDEGIERISSSEICKPVICQLCLPDVDRTRKNKHLPPWPRREVVRVGAG